jgi:CDGSH-type Zn-finger protein
VTPRLGGAGGGHHRPVPPNDVRAEQPALPDPDLSDETVRDEPPVDDPLATITPYVDGPLIVRGDFRLVDTDGTEIDPGRKTVALCRCGMSAIKPFCDGSHKRTGFSAASAPSAPRPAAQLFRGEAG